MYTNTLLGIARKGSDHFTRDPRGTLLGQRTPSNRYYPIADSLGSIVAVTDKDGNLVGRHDYEPFGAEQGGPAFNSPFRFAGELYNPNHKLYKIGARWYDPKLGRWTQPDLIEHPKKPVDANKYQYAGQDPINLTDPSGLTHGQCHWDAGAACGPGTYAPEDVPVYFGTGEGESWGITLLTSDAFQTVGGMAAGCGGAAWKSAKYGAYFGVGGGAAAATGCGVSISSSLLLGYDVTSHIP